MKSVTGQSYAIFWALIRKELYVLGKKLRDIIINSALNVTCNIIIFAYLFPLMGMSPALIAPMFVSILVFMMQNLSWSLVLPILFDLQTTRLIEFYVTLPMSKAMLLNTYIARVSLELFCATFPLAIVGMVLIGNAASIGITNLLSFLLFYILCAIWSACLFLLVGLRYPLTWFLEHSWPRRLSPLSLFSASQFPWKLAYAFNPWIGLAFLANPVTYMTEGLRAALLGSSDYIPLSICTSVLVASLCIIYHYLLRAFIKRIDPV